MAIKKSQLEPWNYIGEYIAQYPNSSIAKVLQLALTNSIAYVRYYENPELAHTDPVSCQKPIEAELHASYAHLMEKAREEDEDSQLGTYIRANPELQSFVPVPQLK